VTDDELNTLRKQLWANGYFPVPNLSKICLLKGWNSKDFYTRDAKRYGGDVLAAIASWSHRHRKYRATGARLQDGFGAIDGDVNDAALMSRLVDIITRVAPDVAARAPARYGGGEHKAAWFVRYVGEPFVRKGTHKFVRAADLAAWRAAGEDAEPPEYHHVEIFGGGPTPEGKCSRQFGVYGPHTIRDDGSVAVEYQWADGVGLAEVPFSELPTLDLAQVQEIRRLFEEAAIADGWEVVAEDDDGDGKLGHVFDIDREATRFDTTLYGVVSYAALTALVQEHGEVRCTADFFDPVSRTVGRCKASWSRRYDCVQVMDWKGPAWHYPADIPHDSDLSSIAGAMERIKERVQEAEQEPEAAPEPEQEDAAAAGGAASTGDGLLTQDLVALVFAEQTANDMKYCHDTGAWFIWDRLHWQQDRKRMAFHVAREISRQMSKREREKKAVKAMRSAGFFGAVERIAATDPRLAVTSKHWDQDDYLMGTPAGTLNLRTGVVRAADPTEGISKLAGMAPERRPTPIWDRFLAQTFKGDEELIRFNQLWFGYGLTGDIKEHALWFGSGSGGNGKGVMLNTITWLMGDYARAAPMDMFTAKMFDGHPTDLAMLRGARLVTASETEEGRAWAESRIKQLTGGDPVSARFMRENFFTYRPQYKISLIGNHNPRLKNVDDAMRRRFNLVPFRNVVLKADQDKDLEQKLRAEGAGIMQWLVDGCLAWQREGLPTSAAVRDATDRYFSDQDMIGQWIADFCEAADGALTTTADLFRSWVLYAHAAGAEPGVQKDLTEALSRRGYEQVRTNARGRCIKGLRIAGSTMDKPGMRSV